MPEVWIPSALQKMTDGNRQVFIAGQTLRQVLDNLEATYPGVKVHLCDEQGILPGIAVVVDGEDTALGLLQPVHEHSEIHFLQAIGGGAN